jgi:hypothetical protein
MARGSQKRASIANAKIKREADRAHLNFFGARTFLSALALIPTKWRTRMFALQIAKVAALEK